MAPPRWNLTIHTLEGDHYALEGDYIIKGVNGEFYPCKPDIFEKTYDIEREDNAHNFGWALDMLKEGKKVQRKGWNGKGQFVYYVPADRYIAKTDIAKSIMAEDGKVDYRAYLALRTAQGDVATWVPSISDCLSDDWQIAE